LRGTTTTSRGSGIASPTGFTGFLDPVAFYEGLGMFGHDLMGTGLSD